MEGIHAIENICSTMKMVIEVNYQALCWIKNTDANTREEDAVREYLKDSMETINSLTECNVFDIENLEQTCGDTVEEMVEEILQAGGE